MAIQTGSKILASDVLDNKKLFPVTRADDEDVAKTITYEGYIAPWQKQEWNLDIRPFQTQNVGYYEIYIADKGSAYSGTPDYSGTLSGNDKYIINFTTSDLETTFRKFKVVVGSTDKFYMFLDNQKFYRHNAAVTGKLIRRINSNNTDYLQTPSRLNLPLRAENCELGAE